MTRKRICKDEIIDSKTVASFIYIIYIYKPCVVNIKPDGDQLNLLWYLGDI